jgi:hypothetical protein
MWVCHHGLASPRVSDGGDGLQIWRVDENILNKQSQTALQEMVLQLGGLRRCLTTANCYTGPCVHGSEPSGSIKGREFLD